METDILLSGKSIFLVRAIWLLVETIVGIRSKQSKEELIVASGQLIFWLMKTIFFLHFLEAPASDFFASFFRSSRNAFFTEILHWKQKAGKTWLVEMGFLLVKTNFFCSEIFPSRGNCHCN